MPEKSIVSEKKLFRNSVCLIWLMQISSASCSSYEREELIKRQKGGGMMGVWGERQLHRDKQKDQEVRDREKEKKDTQART